MNDENDKPKNQPNEDDWSMTMPHQRLDKKNEAENPVDDYFAPKSDALPDRQPPANDWAMTTPNVNVPPQNPPPVSDFDKTTPNVNISQDALNLQKHGGTSASHTNQSADDWSMTAPNITKEDVNLKKDEKKEGWEMPQPTFRVSSGMTGVYKMPQEQPDSFDKSSPDTDFSAKSVGEGASSGQTTPYFRMSEEKSGDFEQAEPVVNPQTTAAPVAKPVSQPPARAKKPVSKLPFIVGGFLLLLFFGAAALAAVYFLFLRQPETTRVLPPVEEKSEKVSLSNSSNPTESSPSLTATQPSLPQEINYKGATMLLIPAGEFLMGSDTSADEAAKPPRKIPLPAFYIDKTEVTNAQYKEFCDATGKPYPPKRDYFINYPNSPVMGISFDDAKGYAEWAGKRLPTEEEWEKAASWDDKTQTKRDFPWGNDFDASKAVFNVNQPSDVGKFPAGASFYGVMDMAGNVYEWVDAFYQPYPNSKAQSPEFGEKNRVVRGGSYRSNLKNDIKNTTRIFVAPDYVGDEKSNSVIGFRCAISADDSRLSGVLQSK